MKSNQIDLEAAFEENYQFLVNIAFKILGDSAESEDRVQEIFLKMWRKKDTLTITQEVKSYLTKSVINSCYDHLSIQKMRLSKTFDINNQNSLDTEAQVKLSELQVKLELALDKLPKKCRVIFSLSRFQGMSGKEIAEHLDLSKKTVDNQIGIALKKLREELSDFLDLNSFPGPLMKLFSL